MAACSEDDDTNEENESEEITSVEVEEVTEGNLVIDKSFYARAEPGTTTPVMLEMPGEVDTLEVSEGDTVDENDTIAKLKTQAGIQNITAPKDGTVVNLETSEGEMASNEDPFALIADLETMNLSFDVTASDHDLFKKEDKYKLKFEGEEYEAEITQIGTMPGETGLFTVKAEVDNEDLEMLPGSIVKLNIPETRVKDSLIVPTEAIVEEEGESFIFVVSDDEATKVEVDIKESQTDKTAIDADVEEGDNVVTKGQLTLTDTSQVNVVEAGE